MNLETSESSGYVMGKEKEERYQELLGNVKPCLPRQKWLEPIGSIRDHGCGWSQVFGVPCFLHLAQV